LAELTQGHDVLFIAKKAPQALNRPRNVFWFPVCGPT